MSAVRRLLFATAALALTLLALPLNAQAAAAFDAATAIAALPAPFNRWNVTITAPATQPQRLTLAFNSPVLGQRVENVVWLPNSYGNGPRDSGVVYMLHGTSFVDLEPATPVIEQGPYLEGGTPHGGYYAGAHRFDTQLARQQYLVVVLDTQEPRHWCGHCWWIDGRDGAGVQAETHLHNELIPLIEALFEVRTDRGGRGIIGHSMGGSGAMIQAFRHPDRFSFLGQTGGTIPGDRWFQYWYTYLHKYYLRSQGYGLPAVDEIHHRAIDPLHLAPSAIGTDMTVVMALGDGCTGAELSYCAGPEAFGAEVTGDDAETDYRRWTEPASTRLSQLGLDHFFIKRSGTHVGIIQDTYARFMVSRINATFASTVQTPEVFSYKSIDPVFSIWGYDVAVARPNTEFLNLLEARTDGRSIVLGGTGTVSLRTPPAFTPRTTYDVRISRENADEQVVAVTADAAGRLPLQLDLGAIRATDERQELIETGNFRIPQTRIAVVTADSEPDPGSSQVPLALLLPVAGVPTFAASRLLRRRAA